MELFFHFNPFFIDSISIRCLAQLLVKSLLKLAGIDGLRPTAVRRQPARLPHEQLWNLAIYRIQTPSSELRYNRVARVTQPYKLMSMFSYWLPATFSSDFLRPPMGGVHPPI
jgi:hypothetical protein